MLFNKYVRFYESRAFIPYNDYDIKFAYQAESMYVTTVYI